MSLYTVFVTTSLLITTLLATVVFIAHGSLSALYQRSQRHNDQKGLELTLVDSPNKITSLQIVGIFIQIISKYIPTPWTGAAALKPHANGQDFALPHLQIRGPLVLSDKDVQTFLEAVKINSSEEKEGNALSLLFLPSQSGPLLPLLLSQRSCPILPLGAVNTSNRFTIYEPGLVRDISSLRSSKLGVTASFGGESRPGIRRKRGVEFCIEIDIHQISPDGTEQLLVKQECYFLMFLSRKTKPLWDSSRDADLKENEVKPELAQASVREGLSMNAAHPRKWAACCKDYNPIHVSGIGARLFGFPAVIAHGNHVLALIVELTRLQRSSEGSGKQVDVVNRSQQILWTTGKDQGVQIEVKFLRPMVLPVHAEVGWLNRDNNVDFVVGKGEKVYTTASCRIVNTSSKLK